VVKGREGRGEKEGERRGAKEMDVPFSKSPKTPLDMIYAGHRCKKRFLRFLFLSRFFTFFNVFYFVNVFYFKKKFFENSTKKHF